MSEITIVRKNNLMAAMRTMKIEIDGQVIDDIKNGERKTMLIGDQDETMSFNLMGSRSGNIDLTDKKNFGKTFIVLQNPVETASTWILIPLAIFLLFIRDSRPDLAPILISIAVPLLFVSFYFKTIGRKKALLIKEEV